MEQLSIFNEIYKPYKITKKVRLIEMFGGIGAQAKALERLKVNFTHYKYFDIDKYAVASYNAIHNTEFKPKDITQIHAQDLEIRERESYTYLLTYSFPCQDLSLAGKGRGMKKGSGTRSGLLWEIERLLKELKNDLPQLLLMENVPQVIGEKNKQDFNLWVQFLENKGYKNYIKILNAKNYGIPQNRERCFMISILGDYNYEFPRIQKLNKKLLDLLEPEPVDESYYLSELMLDYIISKDNKYKVNESNLLINREIACSKTTREGNTRADTSDYISNNLPENTNILKIKNATKKGYLEAEEGDGIDISSRMQTHRGTAQKGLAQTIKTQCENGVVIGTYNYGKSDAFWHKESRFQPNKEIADCLQTSQLEGLVVKKEAKSKNDKMIKVGNWCPSGHNAGIIYDPSGIAPTTMDNHATTTTILVKEPKESKVIGGIGKKGSTNQYHLQNHIYEGEITNTITSNFNPFYKTNLRIRKLTPKECWRLMGFDDEDYEKASKITSKSQLYKQAGNSIVVNVLEAIFKQLF